MCVPQLSEMSSGVDCRDPMRTLMEREEEDHGIYPPKLHPVPARLQNNLHPNPCTSPKSSHQLIHPYNGSSPVLHTGTSPHHPLEALRRLHHPLPIPSSCSPSGSTFSAYSAAQRSPCTPTPQSVSQGQKTPKTPEAPGSPRLGPLSSPPPSTPITMGGGGRGAAQAHTYPHGVIVGGSPLSPSPSLSPSVHNMNCMSPHQRSRHPSASPSPISDQGGGLAVGSGGVLMGSNLSQRRKSTSSSPHSPLSGGSPNPSPHFPKYKLEDILEQFKNSGNGSTNNHHLPTPTNPSLLTNQSSSNAHALYSKPSKSTMSPNHTSGPQAFELNSTGPSSFPLGPFVNHHQSHQSKLQHTTSFPASNLLSAAAKAQLANQITQSSNMASNLVSLPSYVEVLKDAQQPSSKVTNGTLHNSLSPSCIASTRPPHPSLTSASPVLLPSSHSLAQSLASPLPHLPPTTERNASHRKRQRRSPTVLSMLRDTQQLANGPQKSLPGDAVSATAINLSSSSYHSLHSSTTSAVQNQNAAMLENHHHLLSVQTPRLPAPRQVAHLARPPRQTEALDFTTQLTPTSIGLDPPTQPLSALLHLLSVQNAQATASNSGSAQQESGSNDGGGQNNKQSPRLSPSPATHSNVRHRQSESPCRSNYTNPLPLVPQSLSPPPPPSPHFRSAQSPSQTQSTKFSPLQRHSPPAEPASSNASVQNSSSPSRHASMAPSDKHQPTDNHIPAINSSQAILHEASPQDPVARDIGVNMCTSADISHSPGSVSVAITSSPKPLDLSNHVLAILAASSNAPQGEGCSSDRDTDDVPPSQETPTAGEDVFQFVVFYDLEYLRFKVLIAVCCYTVAW